VTTTINSVRNLSAERKAKVDPLYLELNTAIRDDSLPLEYRQRRERELRAQIDSTNSTYERRIREAAMEAMEGPQRLLAAGSSLKPEQATEAQLVAQQYQGRPPRHLVDAIGQALNAGDTTGARIKARAAEALNIQLGSLGPQLMLADPIKKDAHDSLTVIEGLAELALNEPLREKAAAGLASTQERLFLKAFAHDRSLRPDAPFTDQVEPGYTGPDLKRDGTPVAPFPEPHDPERDRQREKVERHRGDEGYDPTLTAKRYEARNGGTPEADAGNLSD
jgi:hypothetical protein